MDIVFKRLTNQPSDKDYKVGDYDFRKHYAGINVNTSWATIEPSIRKATQRFIIPVIGKTIYAEIAALVDAEEELTEEQSEFLEKLKDCVAYFTIFHIGPEINLLLSDTGANERGSVDGTVRPTAQWRYKDFKWDVCKKADELLDELVHMLDQYVKDGVEEFASWGTDPLYDVQKTSFFNSARTFGEHRNISCSRKVFNMMYHEIRDAEDDVYKLICKEQFDALVSVIQGEEEDASPSYKDIIRMIRNYVSAKSLGMAIPRLSVHIDGVGIKFSNFNDGMESLNNAESSFRGSEVIGSFAQKCILDSERARDKLIEFIYDNIEDYPLISASSCYEEIIEDDGKVYCPGDGGIWL